MEPVGVEVNSLYDLAAWRTNSFVSISPVGKASGVGFGDKEEFLLRRLLRKVSRFVSSYVFLSARLTWNATASPLYRTEMPTYANRRSSMAPSNAFSTRLD